VAGREPRSATRGVLTVPVDGDAVFTDAVRRLAAAGIEMAEVALRLPSLDEVFFTLTGRHTDGHDQQGHGSEGRAA
jgi:oleandomycin transport system ATP-binding protein